MTLIDVVLSHNLPVNGEPGVYHALYEQIMDRVPEFIPDGNAIPPAPEDYPDGCTWQDRENWAMYRILHERKHRERYSTFLRRVWGLAQAARELRQTSASTPSL